MSPETPPIPRRRPRPRRPRWAILGERAIEALDPPVRGERDPLRGRDLLLRAARGGAGPRAARTSRSAQFLFSTEWYPTSASNVRYGTLALIVGTLQRHRARHGSSPCPSASARRSSSRSSAAPRVRETLKIVIELLAAIPSVVWGFIGLTVMSKLIVQLHRRAGRASTCSTAAIILALMSVPDHRLDRRGRAEGRARLLPRGRRSRWAPPLAARLPGAAAGGAQRPAGRGAARAWAARWARRWPC